ncbi:hypothetical protein BB560_006419, partial [Smittium megazygosporum]
NERTEEKLLHGYTNVIEEIASVIQNSFQTNEFCSLYALVPLKGTPRTDLNRQYQRILFRPLQLPLPHISGLNWVFSISGYEGLERDHIGRLCVSLGFEFCETFSKKITHLICKHPFSGPKYKRALKWKTAVIGASSLFELVQMDKIPPEFQSEQSQKSQKPTTQLTPRNLSLPFKLESTKELGTQSKEQTQPRPSQRNYVPVQHNLPKEHKLSPEESVPLIALPDIPLFSPIYKFTEFNTNSGTVYRESKQIELPTAQKNETGLITPTANKSSLPTFENIQSDPSKIVVTEFDSIQTPEISNFMDNSYKTLFSDKKNKISIPLKNQSDTVDNSASVLNSSLTLENLSKKNIENSSSLGTRDLTPIGIDKNSENSTNKNNTKLFTPLSGQHSIVGSLLFGTPGMTPLGNALDSKISEAFNNIEKGFVAFNPSVLIPNSTSLNQENGNQINYPKSFDPNTPTKVGGVSNPLTIMSTVKNNLSDSNDKLFSESIRQNRLPLSGLTICISPRLMFLKNELEVLSIKLGASVVDFSATINSSGIEAGQPPLATHLIHTSETHRDHSIGLRWAKRNHVITVSHFWLYNCEKANSRLDENIFGPTYKPDKLVLVPSSSVMGTKSGENSDTISHIKDHQLNESTLTEPKEVDDKKSKDSGYSGNIKRASQTPEPSRLAKKMKTDNKTNSTYPRASSSNITENLFVSPNTEARSANVSDGQNFDSSICQPITQPASNFSLNALDTSPHSHPNKIGVFQSQIETTISTNPPSTFNQLNVQNQAKQNDMLVTPTLSGFDFYKVDSTSVHAIWKKAINKISDDSNKNTSKFEKKEKFLETLAKENKNSRSVTSKTHSPPNTNESESENNSPGQKLNSSNSLTNTRQDRLSGKINMTQLRPVSYEDPDAQIELDKLLKNLPS